MNTPYQNTLTLVGRILLGLIFVLSGFGKLTGFAGAAGYIASKGLPAPSVLAVLTIIVELGGGLALIFGFMTRWAALALAVFTLLAAFIFHNFWAAPADQVMMQNIQFMKNLAIVGGMLTVVGLGAGGLSVDAKRSR
jgi:putative oxidoreductase